MISLSSEHLAPEARGELGAERAKMLAFTSVLKLWRRRKEEGLSQADIAKAIGKDEGWVSRNLKGPKNWTIKTLGEFAEALNGDLEIQVLAGEDVALRESKHNWHAYTEYEPQRI